MARISDAPTLDPGAVDGTEFVPVVKDGQGYKATLDALGEAAADRAELAAETIEGYAARMTPFAVYPAGNARALIWARFLTQDSKGVAFALPTSPVLREIQIYNGNQLRLRFGEKGGGQFGREKGIGAYAILASTTGKLLVDIVRDTGSTGSITTVIGQAYLNLDLITPAGFSGASLELDLDRSRLAQNPVEVANIAIQIEAALATEATRSGPFVSSVRNARLRDDVEDAHGIFTQPGHRYGLSLLELSDLSATNGYWRAQATIRDWTSGVDVAQRTKFFYDDPRGETQHLFLHKGTLAGFTGQQFTLAIKPGAQWADAGVARTFASYAEAGFPEQNMATSSQVESFLDQGPPPSDQDVIVKAAGGDAPTLAAAQAPFYNAGYDAAPDAQKFSTYPNSDIASFWHKLRFYLADPYHDEEAGRVVSLWHSIIQGRGMFNTRIWNDDPALRVFETTWPQWKVDLAVEQFANQYGDHIDQAGGQSKRATVGDAIQHAFLDQGWLRCWYRAHGADPTGGAPSCVGMGGSSGQRQRIISSLFEQVGGGASIPAMFIHTSPGSTRGGFLSIEQGSILRTKRANQQALQLLGSHGQSVFTEIYVSADSHVENGIVGGVLMPDNDPNMPAIARARWPYRVRGHLPDGITFSDAKMRVLTLDAGTSISTASGVAKALFGNGYNAETGQGEALTLDGSVQSLATKLNGLQGATMSLARDGVGVEAITIGNYSGMSEGAILAALNDQLVNYQIGAARIDHLVGVEA